MTTPIDPDGRSRKSCTSSEPPRYPSSIAWTSYPLWCSEDSASPVHQTYALHPILFFSYRRVTHRYIQIMLTYSSPSSTTRVRCQSRALESAPTGSRASRPAHEFPCASSMGPSSSLLSSTVSPRLSSWWGQARESRLSELWWRRGRGWVRMRTSSSSAAGVSTRTTSIRISGLRGRRRAS